MTRPPLTSAQTHLFLPPILRYHLAQYNSPSAIYLSRHYQHLDYFPHALEVLLHEVLDEEVDTPPPADQALLPSVLSFLSSFPQFLDIIVQCTRKTEVRSWQTLFAHLPSPQELFEESLEKGNLKTAGGYLLVLHTLDELGSSSQQLLRLLRRARDESDWELCKDLARFLMALDESGDTLRSALEEIDLKPRSSRGHLRNTENGLVKRTTRLSISADNGSGVNGVGLGIATVLDQQTNSSHASTEEEGDYFASVRQG